MAETLGQLVDALDDDADICMGIYLATMQLVELYETGRAGTAIVLMVKELEERISDRAREAGRIRALPQDYPANPEPAEPPRLRPRLEVVQRDQAQ